MFQAVGTQPAMKWERLHALLRASYPEVNGMLEVDSSDPLGTLILTLLSQSTTDRQAQAAYDRLRSAFSDWQAVLDADRDCVAWHIKAGGLNHQKAGRIQAILARVQQESGELSLDWLQEKEPEQARGFLESLPGVGPKTAACVLLFSLHMSALPVDTHVARLARRLGLVENNAPAVRIQRQLEAMVTPEAARHFHLALIEHGRSICRPRSPHCCECILAPQCDYWKESPAR